MLFVLTDWYRRQGCKSASIYFKRSFSFRPLSILNLFHKRHLLSYYRIFRECNVSFALFDCSFYKYLLFINQYHQWLVFLNKINFRDCLTHYCKLSVSHHNKTVTRTVYTWQELFNNVLVEISLTK